MSKNVDVIKIPNIYCRTTSQKDSNNLCCFQLSLRELVLPYPYHGSFTWV